MKFPVVRLQILWGSTTNICFSLYNWNYLLWITRGRGKKKRWLTNASQMNYLICTDEISCGTIANTLGQYDQYLFLVVQLELPSLDNKRQGKEKKMAHKRQPDE